MLFYVMALRAIENCAPPKIVDGTCIRHKAATLKIASREDERRATIAIGVTLDGRVSQDLERTACKVFEDVELPQQHEKASQFFLELVRRGMHDHLLPSTVKDGANNDATTINLLTAIEGKWHLAQK